MAAALLSEPRWGAAARALISGCVDLPTLDAKVDLLDAVCRALGDELYPALLRVLGEVGRHGEHDARALVAQVLVHALLTGRLPSGRRAAWGASAAVPQLSRSRSFGPLEYLCAWAGESAGMSMSDQREFEQAVESIVSLIDADPHAKRLYCEKLAADADDPIEGSMSRGTRQAVRALASAWSGGATPAEATAQFVAELAKKGAGLQPDWAAVLGKGR
jgi:hypothetical protein